MTDRQRGFVVAVVDDDPGILQSLEYLLQSADHAARVFPTGAALIDSWCLSQIDCLISDLDMPGMDCFELLRRVRASRPELRTILITGYPERLMRMPALEGVYPAVFTKPFQSRELLAAVEDVLHGSRK